MAYHAEVVKLVDTQASGACGGNPVEVRVLSSAPLFGAAPYICSGLNISFISILKATAYC